MGITYVDTVEELLPQCHIVTLHCPLNDSTHHLINAERLGMMRSGSMLINTSRGALVDTAALAAALDSSSRSVAGESRGEPGSRGWGGGGEGPNQTHSLHTCLNFPQRLTRRSSLALENT